jgi:hypothetical protein
MEQDSNPRPPGLRVGLRVSSGRLGARDATHAARPEARDGERGVARSAGDFRIPERPKLSLELPGDLMWRREHLAASLFVFSATFEISGRSAWSGQIADESGIP